MIDSIHQLIMVPRLCMDYVRKIKHLVEQPTFYHTLTSELVAGFVNWPQLLERV